MTPFETLAHDLDEMARAPQRAAVKAAPRLAAIVAAQHRAGLAPDGSAWPLDKDGGVPRLADLGAPVGRAEGPRVILDLPDLFLPHMRLRPAVPRPGEDLPSAYREVLEGALAEELGR